MEIQGGTEASLRRRRSQCSQCGSRASLSLFPPFLTFLPPSVDAAFLACLSILYVSHQVSLGLEKRRQLGTARWSKETLSASGCSAHTVGGERNFARGGWCTAKISACRYGQVCRTGHQMLEYQNTALHFQSPVMGLNAVCRHNWLDGRWTRSSPGSRVAH
jgi:hypothetical protein